jgi:hypothetical protein
MANGTRKSRNDKNPRNPESTLFRKLTRLLSGPVNSYRRQMPRRMKRSQVANYKYKSTSGQQFKKAEYNPYNAMQANFMATQNRAERYIDFDQMEYTPEIASSLDIYADEMTTSTSLNPLINIKCPNEEIKYVVEQLYTNILNIEFNLFGWCRSMCKYGDFFLYLDIDDEEGIKHVVGLPPNEIERLEGEDENNPNYVQYQWNQAGITLENWQLGHFRILGNDKYAPYGSSILEPARRIWRQLTLMEDAVMAYRIVRSPERRVFYIDVGAIAPQDVEQYMQKVMTQMKRNQVVDVDSGRVDLRYNPMSVEEDYFIPVRGGSSSKVESLPGGSYTGDIEDIKYLRDKLFSALKIPASYLSQTEGSEEDKTTLAQKDIRFARTIQRLQRSVISELEKIAIVHLFTLGYRGNDLLCFTLALNNPSKIAELQELETWRTKFDVAGGATEGYFSKRWVAEHIFNMSEEEIVRMQREMYYDKKFGASLEKAVESVTAGEEGEAGEMGGGMGELGDLGDLGEPGAEEGLGGEEGELPPTEAPETEAGGEGEDTLLAAPPAKRDDREYKKTKDGKIAQTTSKSKKHWYLPTEDDKRDMGARRRHMKGQYAAEVGSGTLRNIFKGYQDLKSLSKGVVSENKDKIMDEQENKVLQGNYEVKKLINEMESRQDEV